MDKYTNYNVKVSTGTCLGFSLENVFSTLTYCVQCKNFVTRHMLK